MKKTIGYGLTLKRKERSKRMTRVEEVLLAGETNRMRIAARLGLTYITVAKDVENIYKRWAAAEVERMNAHRLELLQWTERVLVKALDGYERSKKDVEQVTTAYEPVNCGFCEGSKQIGGMDCRTCGGTGKTLTEVTTKKTTGQAGDPAFLRTVMDAVRELGRLRGMESKKLTLKQTQVNVSVTNEVDWSKVSPSIVVKAHRAYEEALESVKRTALDVKSEEV